MKKRVLALLLVAVVLFSTTSTTCADEKSGAFVTGVSNEIISQKVEESIQFVVDSIAVDEKEDSFSMEIGEPITVINHIEQMLFPMYDGGKCEYLLWASLLDDGQVTITYQKNSCSVFDLPLADEYYLFEDEFGDIYVVSQRGENINLSSDWRENNTIQFDTELTEGKFRNEVQLRTRVAASGGAKSIQSKSLSMVYVANGGQYGYCYLASSSSICKYYGQNISLLNLHTYLHGTSHYPYYCPGGSIFDAKDIIEHFTSKVEEYYDTRCKGSYAMTSINQNKPIYIGLSSTINSENKHAAVICGYRFNNTTGEFTYEILDSNESSHRFCVSTYTTNRPVFGLTAGNYRWEEALYVYQ